MFLFAIFVSEIVLQINKNSVWIIKQLESFVVILVGKTHSLENETIFCDGIRILSPVCKVIVRRVSFLPVLQRSSWWRSLAVLSTSKRNCPLLLGPCRPSRNVRFRNLKQKWCVEVVWCYSIACNNVPNSLMCFSSWSFSSWLSMLANCIPW